MAGRIIKNYNKRMPTDPNRLPPQDIEAEQSVLGSLFIDKDAINKVADVIGPEDFYRKVHEIIFSAILDLYKKNEPIDLLTVSSVLKSKKTLKDIGGLSYLTTLMNSVPTASHIIHYAKIIRQKRVLRDLISASHQIQELGWQENEDTDALLDEAEKKIFSVSQISNIREFQHIKDHLNSAFERIDKRHKGDGAHGIPTGFADLDNILAGFQKSDLIVLAARPSLGKTSLALDIARHAATSEKIPVGIFSLEMSKEQLVERLIASEAGVDLWRLRTGKLSDEGTEDNDFIRISQALNRLSLAPIYIDDTASPNVLQIRTMARRLKSEKGLELLIVDYLQLMQGHGRFENRTQEVSEISRALKGLAKELNIPVLAISQLSRSPETRTDQRPKLSDLRESGAIEQDADVVLFIYREDKVKKDAERKNIAEIEVAKHRNGPTGRMELYFNEDFVSFKNLDKHH